jgi:hypothetical protein
MLYVPSLFILKFPSFMRGFGVNSDTYLTTGVLAPNGQPVSEIKVSRLSTNTIRALFDGYKAKRKNVS